MEILVSSIILSLSIYIAGDKIARSLSGKEPEDIKRNLLGKVEQAEVIKREDPLKELLEDLDD